MAGIKPYVLWKISEDKELKLKLTTSSIIDLEEKLGGNLLLVLNDGLPSLSKMRAIITAAAQKYEHGIKSSLIGEYLDEYFENGGSQVELLKDVILPIFQVSGFFTQAMNEQMTEKMGQVDEKLNA